MMSCEHVLHHERQHPRASSKISSRFGESRVRFKAFCPGMERMKTRCRLLGHFPGIQWGGATRITAGALLLAPNAGFRVHLA